MFEKSETPDGERIPGAQNDFFFQNAGRLSKCVQGIYCSLRNLESMPCPDEHPVAPC